MKNDRGVPLTTFVEMPGDPPGFASSANTLRDLRISCSSHATADGSVDGSRELAIDQAEPRIEIAVEVLERIVKGRVLHARLTGCPCPLHVPFEALEVKGRRPCPDDCSGEAFLKIEGSNRTVVYRIVDFLLLSDVFVAEWPD